MASLCSLFLCMGLDLWLHCMSGYCGAGTLPPSWANLPLEQVTLAFNHIGGSLPGEWREMTTLSALNVRNNHLTGASCLSEVLSCGTIFTV